MADLFASGRIVDLILGLMLLEGGALLLYRQGTGRGVPTADLLTNLAAGALLLLALRAALTNAGWTWVALCLAAALLAHLADMARRWRG